jgi:glucose/arabinose dehydrogenase
MKNPCTGPPLIREVGPLRAIAAIATCMLFIATGCGRGASTRTSTEPVDIGQGLKGPSGLKATTYATGLSKAAAFAFDDRGQLWVATADYSDTGQDGVSVISQAGAAPTQVISGLHTPLGLLWHQNSLYVASKEVVDAYSGYDGTAFATHKTVVAFPAGVGEVNGIVLAPDGRMQLGISAHCDHCTPTLELSGAVISFLPDGTDVRVVAKGIRAPIGLTYYPGTSDLFVTMNQRDDLGDQTPGDWLALVQNGQAWGFPDCYGQGGSACAGVPQPIAELDKHAAVSGVAIVAGQLGNRIATSAIVAEWSTGKVQRVAFTRNGSSYAGTVTTLLTGLQNPVPVILGSDNALYVGDWTTGTIYRIAST